uniref:Ovule protein n=1 Tax=Heterorhabditis bacteriophora TaxID=37862 RepID=A0A1I7X8K8_HETBA
MFFEEVRTTDEKESHLAMLCMIKAESNREVCNTNYVIAFHLYTTLHCEELLHLEHGNAQVEVISQRKSFDSIFEAFL